MSQPPSEPAPDQPLPQLSRRAALSLVWLVLLTVMSLAVAWFWSEETWMHFLWVAQAVPVLYWVLMWWGSQDGI